MCKRRSMPRANGTGARRKKCNGQLPRRGCSTSGAPSTPKPRACRCTFFQTHGSILTVILHVNDVPCCWNQEVDARVAIAARVSSAEDAINRLQAENAALRANIPTAGDQDGKILGVVGLAQRQDDLARSMALRFQMQILPNSRYDARNHSYSLITYRMFG